VINYADIMKNTLTAARIRCVFMAIAVALLH